MESEMMKAAVVVGPRKIEIKQVPVPPMAPGMMRIKVSACGVCGSDVHMWKQGHGWNPDLEKNFHMGHEFCGVVTDPGESGFRIGDRVIFWANLYCGECDMCRQGNEHLCRKVDGKNYIGFVCNGGYAEYFTGPIKNAYKLPDSVSDISAALIDPLMVTYHAVRNSGMKLYDKVFVSGSGIIAQLIGALAKKAGASIIAMSRIDDRQLYIAKEFGDFNLYFNAMDKDVEQKILDDSKAALILPLRQLELMSLFHCVCRQHDRVEKWC